jgi:hypothetical protein
LRYEQDVLKILGEDVGKKEPSPASGNASWCDNSGKKFGAFLKI